MRKIKHDIEDLARQAALARAADLLSTAKKKDAVLIADVITCVCEILESENGAMVLMRDMEGNGHMDMFAIGNQFVIPDLLKAAPLLSQKIYADTPEVMQ